jgi:4'-phosphopantetheinyl transferase
MSWIHIYRADLGALPARACSSLLDDEERERAAGITDANAAREFVTTRALVRLLLSRYTGIAARDLRLGYGPAGKPVLLGEPRIHFNVTHSGGVALVAVASAEVGIDLERVVGDVDLAGVADSVFSRRETELLMDTPRHRQPDLFFSIWTRKEAYLKATGQGFSSELREISAIWPAGAIEDRTSERAWYVLDLPAPAGFKAAVVSASAQCKLGIIDATELVRSAIEAQAPRLPFLAH